MIAITFLLSSCGVFLNPPLIELAKRYEVGGGLFGYRLEIWLEYELTNNDYHEKEYKFTLLEGPGIIKDNIYYFIPTIEDFGKSFNVTILVEAPDGRKQKALFEIYVLTEEEASLVFREPELDASDYSGFISEFADKMKYLTFNVDGETIKFFYGSNVYYLRWNQSDYRVVPYDWLNQRLIYLAYPNTYNNNTLKVNGKTYTVTYSVSNPPEHVVATISEKGVIAFHNEGTVVVTIQLAGQTQQFSVNVKKSPVSEYINESKLVEAMGLPDERTSKTFPWYAPYGFFENIYYKFSVDGKDKTVYHWHYNLYPNLIFSSYITSFGEKEFVPYNKGWDSGYCENY